MIPNNDTTPPRRTFSDLCRALERTDPLSIDSQKTTNEPEAVDEKPEASADETRRDLKEQAVENWENEGGEVPSVPVPVVDEAAQSK